MARLNPDLEQKWKPLEENGEVYERSWKMVKWMKQYLAEKKVSSEEKVLVITHSKIIKCLASTGYDPNTGEIHFHGKI
eukprot:CAMPEP_0202966022 /NCGR_PEP_ID=MMETSP1396-20130829/10231_1 /ASSEMBLY_ACC=CAM_ASM_000872 /TAXON_ID= /ORGANISM="Pseudokeronopsis sp., Strain Brazil" /LENGTH=77 /DNA_ID=CAMNT_0049689365 /DNA_START=493 /DNA_END=723 /DNA_ORIENTATION=-